MSDRAYAKAQAQQKTSSGLTPKSSLLQRTCACGQHTIAGGECDACRSKQSTLLRSQRTLELPSAPHAVPGSSPDQGNATSSNSAFDSTSYFGHDFSRIPIHSPAAGVIQTKLAINQPGDHYEQEADRISYQVMRMPEAQLPRACACGGRCSACQKEQPDQEHERLQTKRVQASGTGQTAAPPIVHEVLRSPGQPLDPATRAFMEPRFGHDFSRVRLHSDATAEQSARDVNADAYTVGHNIVFGAGRFAPTTHEGRRLIAHELTHVVQQSGAEGFRVGQSNEKQDLSPIASVPNSVQRKCHEAELGSPTPDCTPSQQGSGGWQFLFKVGCDELLPGEEAKINKLKPGSKLNIHGFASREGKPSFNDDLSCHRANRVAELARAQRADCPVVGTFKHGASPVSAPGVVPDVNPPDFWRSVIIEEVKPTPESGEIWLDPSATINQGWALYARAQHSPTQANLDAVAARRIQLKTWLENISKTLAPAGAQLNRQNLSDYRRFYASAEKLWTAIDQLLALQHHADAAKDTHDAWAVGSGNDQGPEFHAQDVPAGAKYHIDLFGEGYFPGAVNIGMATRTSTTGVSGTRVPNLIYRRFSGSDAAVNHLPIADHAADLVTSENGPLGLPGLIEEIARIIAPGGTIVLYGPDNMEQFHDKVAKLTGGTITKFKRDRAIETKIIVPGP